MYFTEKQGKVYLRYRSSKYKRLEVIKDDLKNINKQIKELNQKKDDLLKEISKLKPKHHGNCVSVIQLDPITNEIINKFQSMKKAEEKTGIDRNKICLVCRNLRKTSGGYNWVYA